MESPARLWRRRHRRQSIIDYRARAVKRARHNNDVLFDFLRKNNVFDFGSDCVRLATDDGIFVAKS